ncbi:MAG: alpha/beta hydrolase, partial [Asticcacaulis sp.]|nr:alpha/beta hydrolase [Asticcacaulis sp.]
EANASAPLPGLVSREVRQVLRLCAADADCNAKFPQSEAKLDALMTAWAKAPATANGKTYTADGMAAFLLDAIYDSEGARKLPLLLDQVERGDYKHLDEFMVAQSDYIEGQFFTHLCKEEFPFESAGAVPGGDPIADAVADDARRFFAVCPAFATGTPDPFENQPLTSSIPTLMLSADIDAGCPAELSEAAVKRLDHGTYVFFPNRTHGVARQSPCAKGMITAFLADPNAKIDTACVKDDQPKFRFILSE